jgi:B12-binding domain/radical SAM domain protein
MRAVIISPDLYTYGAMLIGGVLKNAGYDAILRKDLTAGNGDTVFLSLYSTLHLLDDRVRSFVARHQEQGGICYAGGPVSAYPEILLGELGVDAVVVGEGEETVLRLAENGVSREMQGIAYMDKGEVVITQPAPPAPVEHPLPLIPPDIGQQSIRGASAYIETHRGCIGACTFCQVPRFFGREIRSREIPGIIEEVKAFKKMGATRISISGGTGSLYQYKDGKFDENAFIELLAGIAGVMGPRNVSSPDIRVDCINDDILGAIKQYTIGWLFFGFESGSDRILRLMGKGATVSQATDAIEQCRQHDLHVAGSFIVGYPTETEEDYEATKDFIAEQMLEDVFVSEAEPIPKTPLAELVLKTQKDDNPAFVPHDGEYKSLHLTEAEARAFDLMMHADMYKPGLHVVTDDVFSMYLGEARQQGKDIRAVTELLFKYYKS